MTGGVVYARSDAGGGAFDAMDRSTPLGADDWRHLESLLTEHWKRTGSTAAAALLGRGAATAALFRKFSPAAAAPIDAGCSAGLQTRLDAGSNHLRQGYGGPPKRSAEAEDPAHNDTTDPAYDDSTTPIASAQVVDRERRVGV